MLYGLPKQKGEAMKIYEYTPGTRLEGERVVALGFFDGVHVGHRALLCTAKAEAKKRGAAFAVFTFLAESKMIKGVGRIYSTDEKMMIFDSLGVDEVILADFSAVMNIDADSFIVDSIIADMNALCAVSGEDFRFGKGAAGDAALLLSVMNEYKRDAVAVKEERMFGKKVSSTAIKEALIRADMKAAKEMLGEPYFISGRIERGLGLGHSFGFPTLNIDISAKESIIKRGVYDSIAEIDGERFAALTNVGVCPTVSNREFHAESYLIDCNKELYGRSVRVFLLDFLRDEKKFNNTDELIMQIKLDVERVKDKADGR